MDEAEIKAELLREKIRVVEQELQNLKTQLASLEKSTKEGTVKTASAVLNESQKWPLSQEEYKRYGRQMIVPNIGLEGQQKLKNAKILIVGAGGLGCPAAAYLAGAGVGTIGIIDGDVVETSNLHRQILHTAPKVGMYKVDSAIEYLKSLNPLPTYHAYRAHLTPANAISTFNTYTHVLDCTDNPASRYLISDTCVLLSLPLVTASALRSDGQLMVLNYPPAPQNSLGGGPCYRCIYPKPPPAAAVTSCGEGGILGPVVGTMGVLQALECLKVIIGNIPPISDPIKPSLLLFSSNREPGANFRTVRLRARRVDCFACSSTAQLTRESMISGSLDYQLFCGITAPVKLLAEDERISAKEYWQRYATVGSSISANFSNSNESDSHTNHVLIDVRETTQFNIAHLPRSINIPFSTIASKFGSSTTGTKRSLPWISEDVSPKASIVVLCQRGNDSQVVVKMLKENGYDEGGRRWVGDIEGGLKAWKDEVDSGWPDF